ncbi:MAG: CotH kinase family protein [Mariniblastus sp.]|nr:CotH kinase family protein [Mariniblastus sp.]
MKMILMMMNVKEDLTTCLIPQHLILLAIVVAWLGLNDAVLLAQEQEGSPSKQVQKSKESASDWTLDTIFPDDRVLNVEITVDPDDWNTIRFQSRDLRKEFAPERRLAPIEGPYTYVSAKFVIDGVEFPNVGLRKKGLLGSNNPARPSLKIKLDYTDKSAEIDGLSILTLNNNNQDVTLMSQFMGYRLFNQAGSPAPRCAYAQVKVNGENLGVYCHVESARKPLTKRGFDTSKGTLFEGTAVDFNVGWEGSLDRKFGSEKKGRKKLKKLIEAIELPPGKPILRANAMGAALVPTNGDLGTDWTLPDFDDSSWIQGRNGAGYERQSGFEESISEEFDFNEQMQDGATSIYLRLPFNMEDLSAVDWEHLKLLVKYDDGFVAVLNGERILSVNAPQDPQWDSTAGEGQDDRTGQKFQIFDIAEHKDKFRTGKNVLAIHAMNVSDQSSDMLIQAQIETNDHVAGEDIPKVVEMDDFYKFWAMEGLLGWWDGYSANRNNYFVFLNPKTDKLHFMPWGADAMFEKYSRISRVRKPISVKTRGILVNTLYQTETGREQYRKALLDLLENHWDEDALLKEVDRLEKLASPYMCREQERRFRPDQIRKFIETRREEIMEEIKDGMPFENK